MPDDVKERLRIDSEPNKLTTWFVDKPCQMLCGAYCLLVVITIISIAAKFFALDTEQGREWLVWDDPVTQTYEKFKLADIYIEKNSGSDVLPVRSKRAGVMFFIYEKKTGDAKGMLNKKYF